MTDPRRCFLWRSGLIAAKSQEKNEQHGSDHAADDHPALAPSPYFFVGLLRQIYRFPAEPRLDIHR